MEGIHGCDFFLLPSSLQFVMDHPHIIFFPLLKNKASLSLQFLNHQPSSFEFSLSPQVLKTTKKSYICTLIFSFP